MVINHGAVRISEVSARFTLDALPGKQMSIDAEMKQVYAEAGAPEAWKMLRWDVGHGETPEMRVEALKFFERWLKP